MTDRLFQMVPAFLTVDNEVIFDPDDKQLMYTRGELKPVNVAICSKDVYRWHAELEEMPHRVIDEKKANDFLRHGY